MEVPHIMNYNGYFAAQVVQWLITHGNSRDPSMEVSHIMKCTGYFATQVVQWLIAHQQDKSFLHKTLHWRGCDKHNKKTISFDDTALQINKLENFSSENCKIRCADAQILSSGRMAQGDIPLDPLFRRMMNDPAP